MQIVHGAIEVIFDVVVGLPEASPLSVVISLFMYGLTGFIVIGYGLSRAGLEWNELVNGNKLPARSYLIVLMLFAGLLPVIAEMGNYVQSFYPITDFWEEVFQSVYQSNLAFFEIVVIAPILEETVYRGIILKGFLQRYKPWFAISLSSLLFAVAHLNIWQMIPAFVVALFLGWIFYKTHSLVLVVFSHASYNGLILLINRYAETPGFSDGGSPFPAWLTFLGVSVVLFGVLIFNNCISLARYYSTNSNS
ncbi:CPBP family intramembrane glutamic endopeptidase [Dethiobacter alkaliphilus]|uniref:CPBP family intramembrane glutamic endopeptidase n=1 Tax=Dethiobacter alkaliphilus TaxID=427926 RepID=UPI002227EBE7|nr:type II CAAX endopeptidase family protein [Dethiobacter alkaliphilus]MCW3488588.1 CPBP family intramembrane metalloprotease [Dethiobacter alkaliphilus]